jgi:hypothetical protein
MTSPSCWPGTTLETGAAAPYDHGFRKMSRDKLLTLFVRASYGKGDSRAQGGHSEVG